MQKKIILKWKLHTLLALFMSKCLSKESCLILLGKLPLKLATTFHPLPCINNINFKHNVSSDVGQKSYPASSSREPELV